MPYRLTGASLLVGLLAPLAACTANGFDTTLELAPSLGATDGVPLDSASAQEHADDILASSDRLLDGIDELELEGVEVDSVDMGHVRYRQLHQGLPVFGGEAIVHLTQSGALFRVSDDLSRHLDVDTEPALTHADAAAVALDRQDPDATQQAAPDATLVVLRLEDVDRLAWHVQLSQIESTGRPALPNVLIDAHSGNVLLSWNDLKTSALRDAKKTTWNNRGGTDSRDAVVGDSSDDDLRTTHLAVGATLGFLDQVLGRDSFDDRGGAVHAYGHYGYRYNNAYWDGSRLVLGDGDGITSGNLGVLDITAHELGHALTDYEARLRYQGESGALNEAASDILAAAVEAHVDGGVSQDTWDIGEDTWLDGRALRYMDAPSEDGMSKDHYGARYTGYSDNGGVHINSGIANHWFYLLSQGGQHHRTAWRSGAVVQGIGIEAAADIWYTALSRYMTSSTTFDGARLATEAACEGAGYSPAVCAQVSTAWYEVGVGGVPPDVSTDTGGGSSSGSSSGSSGSSGSSSSSGACPSGWGELAGSVTGTGADAQYPYSGGGGTHQFRLAGPDGADFDLYLYRKDSSGQYQAVASSTSATSDEEVLYNSSGGDHLIQVTSYQGGGGFVLCYDLP
jgi:Zn-dependent metalloprotease